VQRIIIVYFAILVVLVIVAGFLYTSNVAKRSATTTIPTSTVPTTSVQSANTSTTIESTTSVLFSSCLSKNATQPITNGNFSSGTWEGWNATGAGFGSAPFNLTNANNNHAYYTAPWSNYNGSFFATTYMNGLAVQAGNITSNSFRVNELYLNFKIISQQSLDLYVELLLNGKPKIVDYYNTYASTPNATSTFANASIALGTMLCQNASIRVVAGITGKTSEGTNYIAVGDFIQSRNPVSNPTQPVNQTFIS
jgi:hypothetical protein